MHSEPPTPHDRRFAVAALSGLVLLPLAVIAVQRTLGLHGWASSLYKILFLILPLVYCRTQAISVRREILKFHHWRQSLGMAAGLGLAAAAIFWGAYLGLGDRLLDKEKISQSVTHLFVTNAQTIVYIAPITVFLNSLVEEFFYRGFAFGLLVRRHRLIGYLLPAAAFAMQHVLFFWQWMQWIPFSIAVSGLLVFALVLQRLYEKADSLVAPWVVHMFGDIALMTIAVALLVFER